MYPRNKSCILFTLDFVYNLATKHNVSSHCCNFWSDLVVAAAEIIIDAPEVVIWIVLSS